MRRRFIFTSESVTRGHPDKLCDQISDAVVDQYLAEDRHSRVVAECAVASGILFLAVRFRSAAQVDLPNVARSVIEDAGYLSGGFNAQDCTIMTSMQELPASGVEAPDPASLVAGNQVTVFGFACNQTPALVPLPIWLANRLARSMDLARMEGRAPGLAPDGQTQVSVQFEDGIPQRIHSLTLVTSQKEAAKLSGDTLRDMLMEEVILPVFREESIRPDNKTIINVNPAGPVIGGGPEIHAGLTGRKNGIDTYGDFSRHSGAALSGKDPFRIDRAGAYAARHAAFNVVAAGLARQCEVAVSYSIGAVNPMSVQVETLGSGVVSDEQLSKWVEAEFDFRPGAIIQNLGLQDLSAERGGVFFRQLAIYGHFGRPELNLPWEQPDRVERLKAAST
ncbi:MAG: methionine adenosyltransferase [Pseudomonadota bacterium]|nr:methionine adenosyltransferase [Pseudomonadota bacterium]